MSRIVAVYSRHAEFKSVLGLTNMSRILPYAWIQINSRAWPTWATYWPYTSEMRSSSQSYGSANMSRILAVYSRNAKLKSALRLGQHEPYTSPVQQNSEFKSALGFWTLNWLAPILRLSLQIKFGNICKFLRTAGELTNKRKARSNSCLASPSAYFLQTNLSFRACVSRDFAIHCLHINLSFWLRLAAPKLPFSRQTQAKSKIDAKRVDAKLPNHLLNHAFFTLTTMAKYTPQTS